MTRVLITPRSFGKMDPSLFERMETLGWELVRNPFGTILNEAQLIELIADCDGMIAGVDPITADVLRAAPRLKAIARYGVGTDNVDLDYCREHQIAVSRTLGANTEAVADYTFALIMAALLLVA
ncbi:MAG: hydroxyacid dehydrogenase, partial [Clostridia bacterium]|nr:hydroxyacid dehydrogenase [Clostridia bacterium]